ncbi:hypothetical protein DENSPDRAFT_838640 [Dentipellis sp. KUC8613]|nr:hypothetical protein DENSPDRAFT_838640 [Dentipellis sp. KUC8613]
MANMQAYLAEKYMSGPKADAILARTTKKKKKRKAETGLTSSQARGAAIVVDDDAGWGAVVQEEEEDDTKEAVVASDRGFKKRRVAPDAGEESGWATVREPTPPPPADEEPQVVDTEGTGTTPFIGGLLTSKQLRERLPVANDLSKEKHSREEIEAAQETVYRDASGRKIDMKAAKAEAARKKREKEEREAKKMEWGKGLVQRKEEEDRKKELERMRGKEFARRADDEELNQDLKEQERWNDPAAAFLTKKTKKGPRRPEYTGPPPPPNRFGIKPGYRWDGVDRGNGFEKKLFQRQNERKRRGQESHNWSVEDM